MNFFLFYQKELHEAGRRIGWVMSIGSRLVIQPEKSFHILVQHAPQKERGTSVRPVPGLPEWPEVADSAEIPS